MPQLCCSHRRSRLCRRPQPTCTQGHAVLAAAALLCLLASPTAGAIQPEEAETPKDADGGETAAWGGRWAPDERPNATNCRELWLEQPVDQFDYSGGSPTWKERYFLCDSLWNKSDPQVPVLFYAGNEGTVSNAVNTLGLVWDMAAELGALLIWGEVRCAGSRQNERPACVSAACVRCAAAPPGWRLSMQTPLPLPPHLKAAPLLRQELAS